MTNIKTLTIPTVGEDMEKSDPPYTVGENAAKWYSLFGKLFGSLLKKLNIYLSYDPEISLVRYLPKRSEKYMST